MQIRLQITTPAGQTLPFEHRGPVIRIGRDPSCELLLEGEDAGKAASRLHARIELTPTGARLIDTNSANKTLHNNKPIDRPVRLGAGDHIQIGYTGAVLVVRDLDLTPAPSLLPRMLLAVGCLTAFLAVAATVLYRLHRPTPPEKVAQEEKEHSPSPSDPPSGAPDVPVVKNPPTPVPPATMLLALEKASGIPGVESKTVGHYLRSSTTRPSILLQRLSENHPWTVLRSGQAVTTARPLVSLPGYESIVSLTGGVRLNLWGSLPEFSAPVLESAVMLNNPAAGVSLDLTLDRGRIDIDRSGATGRVEVRLRFLREVWDIVLVDPDSRVLAELWQDQAEAQTGQAGRCLGLFTQGKVIVRVGGNEPEFSLPTRIGWSSTEPKQLFTDTLSAPPAWWDKAPANSPVVEDVLLGLEDWATKLDQSTEVIDTVLTVVRESKDRTDRLLGLWFLAALDETSRLIEFLEDNDPAQADIRNTAMYALRDWLARNSQRRDGLTRLIQQRRGFSQVNAARVVQLLCPFSERALDDPATYQTLIGQLEHDKLAVRHLAAQHLYVELGERMPQDALQIDYDPTQESSKRQEAVARWRKAIPAGKLPVPAKDSGS